MNPRSSIFILLLTCLLLVSCAQAITWTDAGGCWTATDGAYFLVKWNTTGTDSWAVPGAVTSIDYVVIGGGGGGGHQYAGGGGAGGFLNGTGYNVTGLSAITITVGAPGAGSTAIAQAGASGGNSALDDIVADGGGGGGSQSHTSGHDGGSGGGSVPVTGVGGHGTAGQGHDGADYSGNNAGGGGGGASEAGHQAVTIVAGDGGAGILSDITGTTLPYSGGGGGATTNGVGANGVGGSDIGGNGGNPPTAGKMDTGSGGGGSTGATASTGAAGSGGVVIIRYITPAAPVASFNLVLTDTSTGFPASWQWNATNLLGNNTPVTIGTEETAIATLEDGNWLIELTATNDFGSNTTTTILGINLTHDSFPCAGNTTYTYNTILGEDTESVGLAIGVLMSVVVCVILIKRKQSTCEHCEACEHCEENERDDET